MANEDEQKPGQKQPEDERRFSQQQYDMLKRCSDKKDMTEWNNWRKEHPHKEICLQGAHLENAYLREANLENASLRYTRLENAKLMEANLRGAYFKYTTLQDADFSRAIVDGETLFSEDCKADRDTKFEAVALGNLRIYPNIKQLLEYNIRRKNWEVWYKGKSKNKWIIKMHQLLTFPVRLFWWISHYGLSTWRIIFTFFALAFVFAVAYWQWPNFVAFNSKSAMENFQGLWHAFYFSVVTMTTLGFGDIAANPGSWKGQGLLMVQVMLGYVLLGALVTRFAVLFTAGGPAGKFSQSTKEK
jgi:hypothetical protein